MKDTLEAQERARVDGERHLESLPAGKRRELVRLCKRIVSGKEVSMRDLDWVDYWRAGVSIQQIANRG